MTLTIGTELEIQARKSYDCFGCGGAKEQSLVLCWDCFKRGDQPFKYFTGTFKQWLDLKKGV